MATEKFENNAATTLNDSGGIDGSVTSFTVTSSSGFPSTGNFRIKVESEYMLVTNVSGTTWTVTRGIEGSAASHADGVDITHIVTAGTMEQFAQKPTSMPTMGEFATYADTTGDQLSTGTYGLSAGAIMNVADTSQPVSIAPSINVGGGNSIGTSLTAVAVGSNTVSANNSLSVGTSNTNGASTGATIVVGTDNVAVGNYSGIIGGQNTSSDSAPYGLIVGYNNQMDSAYGFIAGSDCTVNANQLNCYAMGGFARCYDWGQMSFGGYTNHTATSGNLAQRVWYTLRTQTPDDNSQELFIDWVNGSSSNSKRISIPPNSCMTGTIQVLGMRANYASFTAIHMNFLASNTGTTCIIQSSALDYTHAYATWSFSLGTVSQSLQLIVNGYPGDTANWMASVQATIMRIGGGYYSS